jgi:hypothetical protein
VVRFSCVRFGVSLSVSLLSSTSQWTEFFGFTPLPLLLLLLLLLFLLAALLHYSLASTVVEIAYIYSTQVKQP